MAELQAKTTPAEQASVSAIQARAIAEANARTVQLPAIRTEAQLAIWTPDSVAAEREEDRQDAPRTDDGVDEPATSNRLTKTIMVTVLAIVLCGAVTAVAARDASHRGRLTPAEPTVIPAALSGAAVVRPDVVMAELNSGPSDATGSATATTAGTPAPGTVRPPAPDQPPGTAVGREVATRVVLDFYGSVIHQPPAAFEMLSPGMQGEGLAAFEAAWRGTRSADTILGSTPTVLASGETEDTVHVTVLIERFEGPLLRLVLRMEVRTIKVNNQAQPRIVSAELLSAHRG